jgi:hypothetical protein
MKDEIFQMADYVAWRSGTEGRGHDIPNGPIILAIRTYFGRPNASIRFRAAAAIATSVASVRSVRDRRASPTTRLYRPIDASTLARGTRHRARPRWNDDSSIWMTFANSLAAHFADPDQPFRPIAITDSGDPDHAVH